MPQRTGDKRFELLAAVAQDDSQSRRNPGRSNRRPSADSPEKHRDLLEKLAAGDRIAELTREADRALRLAGLRPAAAETKPPADDLRMERGARDQRRRRCGRRLFFSPVGARCSVCHKYAGRGGNIGPDLTHIGRSTSRERIIASIAAAQPRNRPRLSALDPDHDRRQNVHGHADFPNRATTAIEEYVDSAGKTFTLPSADIEDRHAAPNIDHARQPASDPVDRRPPRPGDVPHLIHALNPPRLAAAATQLRTHRVQAPRTNSKRPATLAPAVGIASAICAASTAFAPKLYSSGTVSHTDLLERTPRGAHAPVAT